MIMTITVIVFIDAGIDVYDSEYPYWDQIFHAITR